VPDIGEGSGSDLVVAYHRFSDKWRPGDAHFRSTGAPPARAAFWDLTRYGGALELYGGHIATQNGPAVAEGAVDRSSADTMPWVATFPGNEAGADGASPPSAVVALQMSTSPLGEDLAEEHDKVKALVDVVYQPIPRVQTVSPALGRACLAGVRTGPGLRCAAVRGGPLDVGLYHTEADAARCRLTAELFVAFDTPQDMPQPPAGSGHIHVLMCRVLGSPANGHQWQLPQPQLRDATESAVSNVLPPSSAPDPDDLPATAIEVQQPPRPPATAPAEGAVATQVPGPHNVDNNLVPAAPATALPPAPRLSTTAVAGLALPPPPSSAAPVSSAASRRLLALEKQRRSAAAAVAAAAAAAVAAAAASAAQRQPSVVATTSVANTGAAVATPAKGTASGAPGVVPGVRSTTDTVDVMWCLFVDADGALCWSDGDPCPAAHGVHENARPATTVLRSAPDAVPAIRRKQPHKGESDGNEHDEPTPGVHSWAHVAVVLDSAPVDADSISDSNLSDGHVVKTEGRRGAVETTSLPLRVTLYVNGVVVYPTDEGATSSRSLVQPRTFPSVALEHTTFYVGPGLRPGWRLTELRLWAEARSAAQLAEHASAALPLAKRGRGKGAARRGTPFGPLANDVLVLSAPSAQAVVMPSAATAVASSADAHVPGVGGTGAAAAGGGPRLLRPPPAKVAAPAAFQAKKDRKPPTPATNIAPAAATPAASALADFASFAEQNHGDDDDDPAVVPPALPAKNEVSDAGPVTAYIACPVCTMHNSIEASHCEACLEILPQ